MSKYYRTENSPGNALDVLVVGPDSKRVNLLERSFWNISVIPNNPGVPRNHLGCSLFRAVNTNCGSLTVMTTPSLSSVNRIRTEGAPAR